VGGECAPGGQERLHDLQVPVHRRRLHPRRRLSARARARARARAKTMAAVAPVRSRPSTSAPSARSVRTPHRSPRSAATYKGRSWRTKPGCSSGALAAPAAAAEASRTRPTSSSSPDRASPGEPEGKGLFSARWLRAGPLVSGGGKGESPCAPRSAGRPTTTRASLRAAARRTPHCPRRARARGSPGAGRSAGQPQSPPPPLLLTLRVCLQHTHRSAAAPPPPYC